MKFEISNLNALPDFKSTVADRVWHAWWKPHGHLFQVVMDFFDDLPSAREIPFCLVAHDDATYIGSVLGIASDLDDRPELSPWVAALWVEPEFRRQGAAAALIKAALDEVFKLGHEVAFLCATAEKRAMYQRQGWKLVEENVGEAELDVFEFVSNH